jgi:hypothetical protein
MDPQVPSSCPFAGFVPFRNGQWSSWLAQRIWGTLDPGWADRGSTWFGHAMADLIDAQRFLWRDVYDQLELAFR